MQPHFPVPPQAPAVPPQFYAHQAPRPFPQHNQTKKSNGWAIVVVLCAVLGLVIYASTTSTAVGVLFVLFGLVVFATMAVGHFVAAAPPIVRTASSAMLRQKWISLSAIAIAFIGGAAGLSQRVDRGRKCDEKLSVANAQRKAGNGDPSAFMTAAEVCRDADRGDDARAAAKDAETVKSELASKKTAEREAQQAAAIAEGRKAAARPDGAADAVSSFKRAAELGALDGPTSKEYALQLRAHAKQLVADKQPAEAVVELEEAKQRDPSLQDVDALLEEAKAADRLAQQTLVVDTALEVAKSKCDSADDLVSAWTRLRTVESTDAQYKRALTAASALERCRRTAYQVLLKGLRGVMQAQRETFAGQYENELLGEGLDVHVRLGGSLKDRLTIEYVLFNRAWAYKITDGGSMKEGSFLGNLENAGFKRVTFSDGFSESFYYDLNPVTEEQTIADKGLATPFRM
jgi:hypothetical protein